MAGSDHEITIAKFQEILNQLKPEDSLRPNQVYNFIVCRNGEDIGYIDLFRDEFESFDEGVEGASE